MNFNHFRPSLLGFSKGLRNAKQGMAFSKMNCNGLAGNFYQQKQGFKSLNPFKSLSSKPKAYVTMALPKVNSAGLSLPTNVETNTAIRRRVGYWLLGSAGLVAGAVIIGGITRLTDSGLSMVNWHPLYGMRPPLTQEEWELEFEEYKKYPEYKYVHTDLDVESFKGIFFWEYLHRMWGRGIGIAFVVPGTYFAMRGYLTPKLKIACLGMGSLIGFQGLLGWYMVKSGLDEFKNDPLVRNDIPRVSQYRLAAHLGSAIVIYGLMLNNALKLLIKESGSAIVDPKLSRFRKLGKGTAHLVFVTALSGAFVAGLDAGLVYNSFPKMADRWIPTDLLHFTPVWRNFFENPTTVQFDHRIMGITTFCTISGLWFYSRNIALPARARLAVNALLGMVCVQVGLGITTLLYYVPVSLAAAHQSGSVALLTIAIWLTRELKRVPK